MGIYEQVCDEIIKLSNTFSMAISEHVHGALIGLSNKFSNAVASSAIAQNAVASSAIAQNAVASSAIAQNAMATSEQAQGTLIKLSDNFSKALTSNVSSSINTKALVTILVVAAVLSILVAILAYLFVPRVRREYKEKASKYNFFGENSKDDISDINAKADGGDDVKDRITLIENTTEGLNVRIEMIRAAKSSLDVVYHTLGNDLTSLAFLSEVYKAAERGARVRILVDGKVGAGPKAKKMLRLMANHVNISCKYYNPVNVFKPYGWNSLLHDKFIIVDNIYFLLGGRNIGDKYFGPEGFTGKISHDRDALVWNAGFGACDSENGSVIVTANKYMELLWNASYNKVVKKKVYTRKTFEKKICKLNGKAKSYEESNPKFYKESLSTYLEHAVPTGKITLVFNPVTDKANEPWVAYILGMLSLNAKESVVMQTPYATANSDFLYVLSETAKDAKSVVMLTNSLASTPNLIAYSNYFSQRGKFLNTGVSIYEYQKKSDSIHGKSLVFDGKLSAIGSFNMDDRSCYIDTETMLIVDSKEFAAELTAAIKEYIDNSLLLDRDEKYTAKPGLEPSKVSILKRISVKLASISSRLLQHLI